MTPEEIELYGLPLYAKGARSATTATHRRCTTCRQWKEYSEYHKDKNREPQIIHICKVCEAERRAAKSVTKRLAKYAKIEAKFGPLVPGTLGGVTKTHKRCPKCQKWRKHHRFGKSRANTLSLASACKDCFNDKDMKRRYGLSLEAHEHLLVEQGGGCAICGATKGSKKSERLFVDHDHETGEVRGLLCHCCNFMLGYAKDNPANLRRGIQYLERAAK